MKMSTIEIGDRCSLGAGSVVLYDTTLKPGVMLSDLSLVMKGERRSESHLSLKATTISLFPSSSVLNPAKRVPIVCLAQPMRGKECF